mmetsp:Transcript_174536/g.553986  ORF Transcript_174536/g.553986 Transcript_174536/m.553986 type:complete len:105 (-) Transcript_174536:14-328(-)
MLQTDSAAGSQNENQLAVKKHMKRILKQVRSERSRLCCRATQASATLELLLQWTQILPVPRCYTNMFEAMLHHNPWSTPENDDEFQREKKPRPLQIEATGSADC